MQTEMTPPVKPQQLPAGANVCSITGQQGLNSSANQRYSCNGMPSQPGAGPALERSRARRTYAAVTLAAPRSSACYWLS